MLRQVVLPDHVHQELSGLSHDSIVLKGSLISHVKGASLDLSQGVVEVVERVSQKDRADTSHLLHERQREAESSLETKHHASILLADTVVVLKEFVNEFKECLILLLALELLLVQTVEGQVLQHLDFSVILLCPVCVDREVL